MDQIQKMEEESMALFLDAWMEILALFFACNQTSLIVIAEWGQISQLASVGPEVMQIRQAPPVANLSEEYA